MKRGFHDSKFVEKVASSKTDSGGSVPASDAVPAWELAVIDVFVRGAAMFGLRRSIAMVFGALYCSRGPLAAQELQEKLLLSRGAVVEALAFLRRLGAVRVHLKLGERRDYFSAETDLKKFVRGFLKEILEPALEKADIRLAQAESAAGTPDDVSRGNAGGAADPASADGDAAAFARSRVAELALWKSRFAEILPLVENFLGSGEK